MFSRALAHRRTTLQLAFQSAAELITQRIRQLGGQAHAPSFSTSISVLAAAPAPFSGMDILAMSRLVADLQRAGRELPEAGRRLSAELSALCLAAPSGPQIVDAGLWADEQVRDLRQRLTMIQRQHDLGTVSQPMAGFGLFGGHAPDPDGAGRLAAAAGNGDATALRALLDMQRTGRDRTLAARLNAWWRHLETAAQDRLIATSPDLVGGLNGLPATVRDRANRRYLAGRKTAITAELERLRRMSTDAEAMVKKPEQALPGRPTGPWLMIPVELEGLYRSSRKVDEAVRELGPEMRQITAVENGLALGGRNGRPPALLLQLELGGPGRTAISFGDPDEADNLVTYVPGTGTTLEGFTGDANRAAVVWDQAHRFQPDKKIASIAWLGYEAPQWGSTLSLDRTVVNEKAALEGAPALAGFTDGLRAAHKAAFDVRLTVLGHSYGSTVAGLAAQGRPGTFADQVIFVGSPGAGAVRAKDLGVGSVWVGEAPNDPVGDVGSLPLQFTGTLNAAAPYLPKVSGPLGVDPSAPEFGARQFYVKDSEDPAYTFKAHSKYWDADSVSLWNLGHLINGKYDKLLPFPEPSVTPTTTPPLSTEIPTRNPSSHPLPSSAPAGG
ncbi:alpha/beta hydrolase [Streptosporangium roseum]|uniref:alpha/beta hydrolase n=1 Tax=Streptosporangium roseum TaxID=2001 RepID=UPI0033282798